MVEFDHVSRRHGSFRLALNDVSFVLPRAACVVLQGPNGAGKTTALRLVAGLDAPTSGRVCVAGQDLARLKSRALPVLRRSLGVVPQERWLLDDRSVLDNVLLPARAAGLPAAEGRQRAEAALARCHLDPSEVGAQSTAHLSTGARLQVALARALVNRPALLLVDEPLADLDQAGARRVVELLGEFAAAGVTVLAASRDERGLWGGVAQTWRLQDGRLTLAPAAAAASPVPAAAGAVA